MSTYKLYYFNGRGYGELSRLIFAAAGQKYEDIRIGGDQWPTYKAEMPLGQVPVLEVDGTKLPQSITIARFLARRLNLAGKDKFEQAKVDAIVDTVLDLLVQLNPTPLPKHLQNLEIVAKLYSNGGPYFVGNNLTWADLSVYDTGETLLQFDGNSLNSYPWLKQNRAEVEKQPKIAEYLKKRPKTSF